MAPLDESRDVGSTPFELAQKAKQQQETVEKQKTEKLLQSLGQQTDQYLLRTKIFNPNALDAAYIEENKLFEVSRKTLETPTKVLIFTDSSGKEIPAVVLFANKTHENIFTEYAVLPDGSAYEIQKAETPAPIPFTNEKPKDNITISRISLPTKEGKRYPLWKGALESSLAQDSNYVKLATAGELQETHDAPTIKFIYPEECTSSQLENLDNLMRTSLLNTQPVT